MAQINTWIDVNLDEFDDEDLVEDLQSRGYIVFKKDEEANVSRLFDQYRTNHPNLMDTLRVYLMEQTGRVLP